MTPVAVQKLSRDGKLISTLLKIALLTAFTKVAVQGNSFATTTNVQRLLEKFNQEMRLYRHFGAELAWNMSIDMSQDVLDKNEQFTIERNIWTNEWCSGLMNLYKSDKAFSSRPPWTLGQLRELYLICRGPRFTSYQLSNVLQILSSMQKLYNKEVCIKDKCMRMEPDLNRIMESSRDEMELKDVWTKWHRQIGADVQPLYVLLIQMLNKGARQAGHIDMGDCWREETEIPNLKGIANKLYSEVKPLYQMLHTFVRFKLEKFYKMDFNGGPIPSHLLGNMYAQNWQSLIDIVWEDDDLKNLNKDEEMKNPLMKALLPKNATVLDMVKSAEDFFVSMGEHKLISHNKITAWLRNATPMIDNIGLPKLPRSFWINSYFEEEKGSSGEKSSAKNCHGSAANMFGLRGPDYRMMMCAEVKDEDLVTFQHEIGHIVYFMAYQNLPTIFQDGANSAFHESVGDSVTYDLKPKFIRKNDWIKSLLKMGLAKLPQVGYGLVMDTWRWNVFEKEDAVTGWNKNWWKLHHDYLGVTNPEGYKIEGENAMDAAGKFHIIDNIPYIRYFLASFLQIQFYESMCASAGWKDMHSCKIRGSKNAGQLLWQMMSRGTSQPWTATLMEMTGSKEIKSTPLLNYFKPLENWLESKIRQHNLTLGW